MNSASSRSRITSAMATFRTCGQRRDVHVVEASTGAEVEDLEPVAPEDVDRHLRHVELATRPIGPSRSGGIGQVLDVLERCGSRTCSRGCPTKPQSRQTNMRRVLPGAPARTPAVSCRAVTTRVGAPADHARRRPPDRVAHPVARGARMPTSCRGIEEPDVPRGSADGSSGGRPDSLSSPSASATSRDRRSVLGSSLCALTLGPGGCYDAGHHG